jgi:hypothetical protein
MSDNRLIASPSGLRVQAAIANLIMLDGGRAAVTGQMEEPVLAVAGERGGKDRSG